jgi:hypothetical protein
MRSIVSCFILVTVLLAGCGASRTNTAPFETIQEKSIQPGDPIPAPNGPVILSFTGKIGTTNTPDKSRLDFDLATLEKLGLVSYDAFEQETKRVRNFTGVLLSDVLQVVGISPDSKELYAVALDDYKTTLPLNEISSWPVIIATYRDGQRIPSDERGPIQIVFPNEDYNIDPARYNPMWVWQLRVLEAR